MTFETYKELFQKIIDAYVSMQNDESLFLKFEEGLSKKQSNLLELLQDELQKRLLDNQ